MYIKHVKPMKRAHNKKRSVYRGEKFVRKKSIDIAALLLVLLILLLAGSAVFLILSYFKRFEFMKKRNQTCGDTRSSANTRSDERRKTLSLVTAVIMAVSCIACVIIKAVGKGNFSVHEILLYAAWALLAAESFLAAFSNGSRIQKVLRILLAAAAIGLASVSFIIFNNMY